MKRFGCASLRAVVVPHQSGGVDRLCGVGLRRWCATSSVLAASSDSSPTTRPSSSSSSSSPTVSPGGYKSSHQGQGKPMPKQTPTLSSCAEDAGSVASRPLTALQRRMLQQKEKAVFALTPNAIYRVKTLLQSHHAASSGGTSSSGDAPQQKQESPIGIRIGVKKRGCSGYSYTVNYEYAHSPKKPNDARVDQGGVSIFVDGDALFYVIGTNMDFTVTSVEEKFTFSNPNQKHQCGCGESFMPFDA